MYLSPLRKLLLSSRGRISRREYFLAVLPVLYGSMFVISWLHDLEALVRPAISLILRSGYILLGGAAIYSFSCLTIKRLHDFSLSWRWLILPVVGLMPFVVFSAVNGEQPILPEDRLGVTLILISIFSMVPAIVLMFGMFTRGSKGTNDYGGDPLAVLTVNTTIESSSSDSQVSQDQ